jgi:hypothetical protein
MSPPQPPGLASDSDAEIAIGDFVGCQAALAAEAML